MGDMIVEDLPTGSVMIFAFNLFTSFFFQFFGFIITYFLSTTHAAKYGSRAGLGLTFIQYGAYWRVANAGPPDGIINGEGQEGTFWNSTIHEYQPVSTFDSSVAPMPVDDGFNSTSPGGYAYGDFGWNGKDWVALVFMTLGKAFISVVYNSTDVTPQVGCSYSLLSLASGV